MKKIVFICLGTICLVGCQKILQSILPEKPYTLFLEEEHFTIIPEKSSFKVGDTINIKISFPEHLKSEHGNNDLKLIFKKDGEFKLKRIVPMISINYYQSCTYTGNKSFKVEP